jgi:hypothetical protein
MAGTSAHRKELFAEYVLFCSEHLLHRCLVHDARRHRMGHGMQGLIAQLAKEPSGSHDPEVTHAWEELCSVRRMQWEKTLKIRLESAVEQFNEDYKKGFQFMQARCSPFLLPRLV